ncbi:methyl-accepting chemotaxis protein [Desulfurispirillum indicum]|uniref:methyl-accepting chemotaxis protein n=1 Tax=Desulfurispirillum indicum TaxID=936456 RepID=UPI001CFC36F5|nr:methyl-accepting chemotaxis protein [Desulfurispirillum indicum]UCZ56765.1 methyl-accepting chemotaxis protein [Desulfurispirillum indicum]
MVIFSRFSMKLKLAVLVLVPVGSLLLMGSWLIMGAWQQSRTLSSLALQVDLSSTIGSLVHELQRERGLSAGMLGSQGEQFRAELRDQHKNTDQRVAELEAFLSRNPSTKQHHTLDQVFSELRRLASVRGQVSSLALNVDDTLAYYTAINHQCLQMVAQLSLLSDDAAITRNLTAYASVLSAKEYAGIERAVLTNTFSRQGFAPGMYMLFLSLVADQQTHLGNFTTLAGAPGRQASEQLLADPVHAEVERMRGRAQALPGGGDFGVDSQQWFSLSTKRINLLKQLEDAQAGALVDMMAERQSSAAAQLLLTFGHVLASLLVTLGLAMVIARELTKGIFEINTHARALASGTGDLRQRLESSSRDELGTLSRSFNTFIESMDKNVSSTMELLARTAGATASVLEVMEHVRLASNRNLDTTSEVSTAAHEMNATIHEISSSVSVSTQSSLATVDLARDGVHSLRESTASIQQLKTEIGELAAQILELQSSAQEIRHVVSVINDISEQTNLLALNAAIEAARAGESGRGFSVVADEVRKLAENTQNSTGEIEKSIAVIVNRVEGATISARRASETADQQEQASQKAQSSFQQIMEAIEEVGDMMSSINAALEQQSTTTGQVAASIEQLAGSSEELSQQVNTLVTDTDMLVENIQGLGGLYGKFQTSSLAIPCIRAKITHVLLVHGLLSAARTGQHPPQMDSAGMGDELERTLNPALLDVLHGSEVLREWQHARQLFAQQVQEFLKYSGGEGQLLERRRNELLSTSQQYLERLDSLTDVCQGAPAKGLREGEPALATFTLIS